MPIRLQPGMGCNPSIPQPVLAHFIKCERTQLPIIQHRKTGQLLIQHSLVPDNQQHRTQIICMLEKKLAAKSPFVTQVVYWQPTRGPTAYCQPNSNYQVLFNNVGPTLAQFLATPQCGTEGITGEQATRILEAALRGLKYYSDITHLPEHLSTYSIIYDGRRAVVVDPWIAAQLCRPSPASYQSPQNELYFQDQITAYDKFNSLLYELGLLLLDLTTNCLYSRTRSASSQSNSGVGSMHAKVKLGPILETIQDFKLRSKLSILLSPSPEKRRVIYTIMLPDKVALKQFNPARCQNPTKFYVNPTKGREVRTEHTSLSRNKRKPVEQSPETSFTYAQMLRTPTQTNSNNFESKRSSPSALRRQSHSMQSKRNLNFQEITGRYQPTITTFTPDTLRLRKARQLDGHTSAIANNRLATITQTWNRQEKSRLSLDSHTVRNNSASKDKQKLSTYTSSNNTVILSALPKQLAPNQVGTRRNFLKPPTPEKSIYQVEAKYSHLDHTQITPRQHSLRSVTLSLSQENAGSPTHDQSKLDLPGRILPAQAPPTLSQEMIKPNSSFEYLQLSQPEQAMVSYLRIHQIERGKPAKEKLKAKQTQSIIVVSSEEGLEERKGCLTQEKNSYAFSFARTISRGQNGSKKVQ